jgi:hypothetical protein
MMPEIRKGELSSAEMQRSRRQWRLPTGNHRRFRLRGNQAEKLGCGREPAGFLVVKHFFTVFEDLELTGRSGAHFYFNAFFGSGFAQAHGRASQVKSKKAALYFNHCLSPRFLLQPGWCLREWSPCLARCEHIRPHK